MECTPECKSPHHALSDVGIDTPAILVAECSEVPDLFDLFREEVCQIIYYKLETVLLVCCFAVLSVSAANQRYNYN